MWSAAISAMPRRSERRGDLVNSTNALGRTTKRTDKLGAHFATTTWTWDTALHGIGRLHVGEVFLPDGTEWLTNGIRLDGAEPLRADVYHVGVVLDFCHTTFGAPIATKAIAVAVSSIVGVDVQCIPITISGQTGRVVLNALRSIRCVDESRSEFDNWTEQDERPDKLGKYHYISRLVLERNAIPPDAHFFRVKDWTICLIVSEVVKDAMERVGCYGAEFIELEIA